MLVSCRDGTSALSGIADVLRLPPPGRLRLATPWLSPRSSRLVSVSSCCDGRTLLLSAKNASSISLMSVDAPGSGCSYREARGQLVKKSINRPARLCRASQAGTVTRCSRRACCAAGQQLPLGRLPRLVAARTMVVSRTIRTFSRSIRISTAAHCAGTPAPVVYWIGCG